MKSLIVYDPNPNNDLARKAITSLCKGLKAMKVPFDRRAVTEYEPSGLAVVVGWLKKLLRLGGRHKVITQQKEHGHQLLVLERAWLKDRDNYHALTWNGFGGYGENLSRHMPCDRFDKLGIKVKPWRTEGKHILVCGQVPWDAQVDGGNHVGWVMETLARLKELSDRPIVFRMHPKVARNRNRVPGGRGFPMEKIQALCKSVRMPWPKGHAWFNNKCNSEIAKSLRDDLRNCWALVAYNSNAAVDATIEGIPCFLSDKCGRAWPVANTDIEKIEDPKTFDRSQWVFDLAYDQWNNKELESGEAWRHITRGTQWQPK